MEKTDKYIGKMLDNRYEILEVIGVGGMAYVYKARCHLLNRLVAIKILKEDYANDADFRRRFHAESQAVAMLSHPNIVAVYDVSRSRDLEYIVMELIDGITLKQYMSKKGVLSWREGLHFVSQIVKALSHAHNRGIIHRDIKPHNIMILRDGSVKVADFGIARFASKQNTLTQEALGSVHYISPEQARGSHIDARSDIYSVGVVLYEMLTGRLPFEGDSAVSVAIQHINSLPLAPREINHEIPQALEIITIKAMAPQITKRYGSAEEMLKDLEEFRKNPAIVFDYNIHELQTTADQESRDPGVPSRTVSVTLDNRKVASEKKRIHREEIVEENHKIRKSNNFIAVLLLVFSVLVLISILGYYIYAMASELFAPGNTKKIPVPNLRGMTYSTDLVASYEKQFIIEPVFEPNDQYPQGYIYDQNPKSGIEVQELSTITVYVSSGAKTYTMPEFSGQNERDVKFELERMGLKVVTEYQEDPDVPSGSVISTDPAAGTTVTSGDTCNLLVSLGAKAEQMAMPRLVGYNVQEVYDILASKKLVVGRETTVKSDKPSGEVVWQSVPEGSMVVVQTVIDIEISEGPEEEPFDPDVSSDVTADPSAPDVSTPAAEDEPIAVQVVISVPSNIGNNITLRIEVDNKTVVNEVIQAGAKKVTYTLTGLPNDQVNVFFNDKLEYTKALKEMKK